MTLNHNFKGTDMLSWFRKKSTAESNTDEFDLSTELNSEDFEASQQPSTESADVHLFNDSGFSSEGTSRARVTSILKFSVLTILLCGSVVYTYFSVLQPSEDSSQLSQVHEEISKGTETSVVATQLSGETPLHSIEIPSTEDSSTENTSSEKDFNTTSAVTPESLQETPPEITSAISTDESLIEEIKQSETEGSFQSMIKPFSEDSVSERATDEDSSIDFGKSLLAFVENTSDLNSSTKNPSEAIQSAPTEFSSIQEATTENNNSLNSTSEYSLNLELSPVTTIGTFETLENSIVNLQQQLTDLQKLSDATLTFSKDSQQQLKTEIDQLHEDLLSVSTNLGELPKLFAQLTTIQKQLSVFDSSPSTKMLQKPRLDVPETSSKKTSSSEEVLGIITTTDKTFELVRTADGNIQERLKLN